MVDVEKQFIRYARAYNQAAKRASLPLYPLKPPKIKLGDMMCGIAATCMNDVEALEFRSAFERRLLEGVMDDLMPLAATGLKRVRQAAKFGREGSKGNQEEGAANSLAVLNAAKEILGGWEQEKRPSGRRLAQLIELKTEIPSNTVRGHLKKLREKKKLD